MHLVSYSASWPSRLPILYPGQTLTPTLMTVMKRAALMKPTPRAQVCKIVRMPQQLQQCSLRSQARLHPLTAHQEIQQQEQQGLTRLPGLHALKALQVLLQLWQLSQMIVGGLRNPRVLQARPVAGQRRRHRQRSLQQPYGRPRLSNQTALRVRSRRGEQRQSQLPCQAARRAMTH